MVNGDDLVPAWSTFGFAGADTPSLGDSRRRHFITQSKVVAQLTLLVAITVLHRSCSVAAEPLHR